MATLYTLHPTSPQAFKIEKIRRQLQSGAVMLYATDTVYAIGCDLQSKNGIQRVRQLKKMSNDKPLTFMCPSLSNIAQYAYVSDPAYRTMRYLVPGPYTFILPATKLVPKLVMNPKRKTTGIRVPDHPVCQALLHSLGHPIISTSAHVEEMEPSYLSRYELFDALEKQVDVIIDSETEPSDLTSTILDMTEDEPVVVRQGLGFAAVADIAVMNPN